MLYNAYQDTEGGIGGVSVVSCGHIFARKGRRIDRPSGRSDYLLFYVVKGKEHFMLKGETVAREGSFVFFRPFEKQQHAYKQDQIGEFYFIHFNAPADFDLFGFESSLVYDAAPSKTVCTVFEEIISELQKKQPAYERLCASMLFRLLAVLERKTKSALSARDKHFEKISFVVQKMNMEYQSKTDLEHYARLCNMSKYHFLRVFKNVTGVSPLEYKNNVRLSHAKEEILNTTTPISEIGEKMGFTSASYFCEAFKKRFGIAPSKLRKTADL